MRGKTTDVLGGTIAKAPLCATPLNKFVNEAMLNTPLIFQRQMVNRKERLVSQRNIPLLMVSHPQPNLVQMYNQPREVFLTGKGIAALPDNLLWQKIKGAF